jgi:NADH-quinone oxidoreductase subunit N
VAIRFFFAVFEKRVPGGGYVAVSDLPWPAIIGIISAITMTLGNLTALVQTNLKRLFAYSSIAHAGYLLMGLAAASIAGVQSILIYLMVYVLMNVGAFLVVIVVSRATGGDSIDDMRGLGVRAPIAALMLTIFLFSLTGIPPFAGFTGKYLIFAALVQKGGLWNVILAVIGVLNSALSLFYYAKIIKAMYLEHAHDETPMPVPGLYTGILVTLGALVMVFGVYWTPLARWAAAAFGGGSAV